MVGHHGRILVDAEHTEERGIAYLDERTDNAGLSCKYGQSFDEKSYAHFLKHLEKLSSSVINDDRKPSCKTGEESQFE